LLRFVSLKFQPLLRLAISMPGNPEHANKSPIGWDRNIKDKISIKQAILLSWLLGYVGPNQWLVQ
jgi:hypothetical protein